MTMIVADKKGVIMYNYISFRLREDEKVSKARTLITVTFYSDHWVQ